MDLQEVAKRALKYIVEGVAVAVAMFLIGKNKFSLEETLLVALVAASTFAVLDLAAPSISYAARQGAGFGLGLEKNMRVYGTSPLFNYVELIFRCKRMELYCVKKILNCLV